MTVRVCEDTQFQQRLAGHLENGSNSFTHRFQRRGNVVYEKGVEPRFRTGRAVAPLEGTLAGRAK